MKRLTKTLFVFGFAYAITATSSFAQIFTFDENGNITMNGGPDPVPVPSQVAPDPTAGVTGNVLIYTLPFQVTPGDVALLEPGGTASIPSDIVRFYTPSTANFSYIIFYSDVEAGEPNTDLADSGLPVSPNAFPIPEVGPEGNNGAAWNPIPGQPGSAPTGVNIQYNIISDVPEPGTLAFLVSGVGILFGINRFRQKGLSI